MPTKEATVGNKRKIEELVELYRLHPKFRDLFVEGPRDMYFFTWFLREAKQYNSTIYEISTIDITSQVLDKYVLLHKSNKHKVIALALELEPKLTGTRFQATCIVDRDYDSFLKKDISCNLLLFTDYSCLEMYSFNEKCLSKFLDVFIGGIPHSPQHVLAQLVEPLKMLFLIRLANESMSLGLTWIDFDKCFILNGQQLIFHNPSFVRRYLNSNAMLHKEADFLNEIRNLQSHMPKEPRLQIHGHDYINLLSFYLKRLGVDKNLYNTTAVQRGLFTSAEYHDLVQEPLFKNLLARTCYAC